MDEAILDYVWVLNSMHSALDGNTINQVQVIITDCDKVLKNGLAIALPHIKH